MLVEKPFIQAVCNNYIEFLHLFSETIFHLPVFALWNIFEFLDILIIQWSIQLNSMFNLLLALAWLTKSDI